MELFWANFGLRGTFLSQLLACVELFVANFCLRGTFWANFCLRGTFRGELVRTCVYVELFALTYMELAVRNWAYVELLTFAYM